MRSFVGLQPLAMADGNDTLLFYQYSQMHQMVTARADSRGNGVTAGIVGNHRGYQKTVGCGK